MNRAKVGLFLATAVAVTLLGTGCGGKRVDLTSNPNPTPTIPVRVPIDPPIHVCPEYVSSGGGDCGGPPIHYPIVVDPIVVDPISSGGSSGGIVPVSVSSSGSSGSASISGDTKDVDLQRAALQTQDIEDRAQGLASQFSMNIDAARNLTQIADKMSVLTNQSGGMTDDDRTSLTEAALGAAGISNDQVSAAYANYLNGDTTAVETLLSQAATNLGMPSSAGLKDQILPSLGINLGQ